MTRMKNVSLIIDFLTGKFQVFIFELTCGEFLFVVAMSRKAGGEEGGK